ncbi:MAG TPA: glycerol acyltransferase [Crocinitomix sp.]|nr:glycerol acyltransferase [Crocinitomix sp.]
MEKFIDVDKILKDKNPNIAKWMPKFVVKYLKKVLHQNEINQILTNKKGLNGVEFSKAILSDFNNKTQAIGLENIPKTGGVILACNHPLGGMDALILIQEISKVRTDFKFVVNDVLLNLKNLQDVFVGVNKYGNNSKTSLNELNELFASNQAVVVFPAGLVSRKFGKEVKDLEWKKTFITRAKKFNRDVIPVYIDGKLSNFFYRLYKIRKFFGVKANVELFYLIDETLKQKNKKYKVFFGKPIKYTKFDKSKSDKDWAEEVKKMTYKQIN